MAASTGLAASSPNPATLNPVIITRAAAVEAAPDSPAPIKLLASDLKSSLPAPAGVLVTPDLLQKLVDVRAAHPRPIGPSLECMAKVVYHEAANQALPGQLAVAQVIINRARTGKVFPRSVCAVVNQDGQFFKTSLYRVPPKDARRWRTAVAVAALAQEGRLSQVAPGALFYHAAYVRPAWRHDHARVARIGDHIFYR